MAIIQSGVTPDVATVGPVSKGLFVELRTPDGTPISQIDKAPSGITPGVTRGYPHIGVDYKTPRLVRSHSDGSQVESIPTLLLTDQIEGAAFNPNIWIQTAATMAAVQASGVLTLNSSSSTTITNGIVHASNRFFPLPSRSKLLFRSRQRHTAHFANNVIELGLVTPMTSATNNMATLVASGAYWQKDAAGQYIPRLAQAGGDSFGTLITNAAFVSQVAATEYALFEVEMDQDGAWFRIYTSAGVLVTGSEQRLDFTGPTPAWTATHFQAFYRIYNSGAVPTAVQLIVGATSVYSLDTVPGKSWSNIISGLGGQSNVAPLTAFGQTANYTVNAAPTTRSITSSTELETTLGGHISWNNAGTSFAGSEADLILFGYTVPANYNLFVKGIRISSLNLGAANAAAPYTLQYFITYNHTSATITPGTNKFIPLGYQLLAASAAIGVPFDRDTVWNMDVPIHVLPGRRFTIGCRVLAGTATLNQVIRSLAAVDGWFE